MNPSAWFVIGVFALFAVALTTVAVLGARRDRGVEAAGWRPTCSGKHAVGYAHPRDRRRKRGP
jgi:hypothetical protein